MGASQVAVASPWDGPERPRLQGGEAGTAQPTGGGGELEDGMALQGGGVVLARDAGALDRI